MSDEPKNFTLKTFMKDIQKLNGKFVLDENGNPFPESSSNQVIRLQYEEVMQRLDNLNRIDLDERLSYIETHLKNCLYSCTAINNSFQNGIKIKVDEQTLNVINPLKEILKILKDEASSLRQLRKEIESDSVIGTLKFMSKTLHELSQEIHSIKENGVKKDIQLSFTLDGYEMVKKRGRKLDPEDQIGETKIDVETPVKKLLETLVERERKVLIHRYGLFGETSKTLALTGSILNISKDRIRQIQQKALMKCRLPMRRELAAEITHRELRKDILGE